MSGAWTDPVVVAAMVGAFGALCGLIGVIITRLTIPAEKAPDMQTALNGAVTAASSFYAKTIADAETAIQSLRAEVADMREEISALNDHIEAMTAILEKNNIPSPPPPRRKRAAACPAA